MDTKLPHMSFHFTLTKSVCLQRKEQTISNTLVIRSSQSSTVILN